MAHGRKLLAVLATALPMLLPAGAGAATINVDIRTDEFNNDGECSLREAVQSANVDGVAQQESGCEAGSGNDTVRLFAGSPYALTTAIVANDIATGDLEVTDVDGTSFLGDSRTTTTIDGGDQDRVLDVTTPTGTVVVNSVTIQNGLVTAGNGGGILTQGNLTLSDARVTSNQTVTSGSGGGILATGLNNAGSTEVTLLDSSVDDNDAAGAGGAVNLSNGASLTASGGSHLDSNSSLGASGGAINSSTVGDSDITLNQGVTVNGNDSVFSGGAIQHNGGDANSVIAINGANLNGNTVNAFGASLTSRGGAIDFFGAGGIQITDAKLQNNGVDGAVARGGAINATMTSTNQLGITRSLLTGNTVTVDDDATDGSSHGGGAVTLAGQAAGSGLIVITDSRIGGNTLTVNDSQDHAVGGGVLSSGELIAVSSTFDGNVVTGAPLSSQGGGIGVNQPLGPTRVLNSTFSANDVLAPIPTGGGLYAETSLTAPATIAHSTFTGNDATTGESLTFVGGINTTYTVRGSIFAEDGASACVPGGLAANGASPGYNVDAGTTCAQVGDADLENTLADLGQLTENGGPLYGSAGPALTHALIGPAPALNLVPAAACDDLLGADLLVDQRGAPRPTDGGCEPGAYELITCFAEAAFVGSSGDDTIDAVSFPGRETFAGLDGADTITGDGDPNRLCGGDDGDTILARDGVADQIDCGPGTDTAQTDALTVDTVVGCETVDVPVETPPPTGTPTPPAPGPVETGRRAAAIKKCKKKFPKGPKRKKCIKKAKRLPV